MSPPDEDVVLAGRVRIMQIILLALVAGCLGFLVIALVVRQGAWMGPPAANPILTYIAIGFAVIVLVQATILPNLLAAATRRQMAQEKMPTNDPNADSFTRDTGKLAEGYQKHLIITAAPVEGGIFFLLVAYLVEGSLLSIIGAIVLLVFLGSKFPTRLGVERWIEEQRDLLQHERTGF